jgi:hypothetical protein
MPFLPKSRLAKRVSLKIDYARVSTDDQNLALQRDALTQAGCERIFEDKRSGAKAERPGLKTAMEVARKGDLLVVWRLDRLGRSLSDLIGLSKTLEQRGIGLKSLKEQIDTTRAVDGWSSPCSGHLPSSSATSSASELRPVLPPLVLGDARVDGQSFSHPSAASSPCSSITSSNIR